jgi:WD40 repeat protein
MSSKHWRTLLVLSPPLAVGLVMIVIGLRASEGADAAKPAPEETAFPVHLLHGHTGPVHSLRFTPDGRLVSASGWPQSDHTVRVWDLTTKTAIRTIDVGAGIHSLDLSGDGRFALVGLNTGAVKHLDLQTGQTLKSLKIHKQAVGWVAFTGDGKQGVSKSD